MYADACNPVSCREPGAEAARRGRSRLLLGPHPFSVVRKGTRASRHYECLHCFALLNAHRKRQNALVACAHGDDVIAGGGVVDREATFVVSHLQIALHLRFVHR